MSKKPTPLQAFKTLKQDIGKCYEEESIIVEEALKENEKLKECYKNELKNVSYYNNLALKYKKALEIIKEKKWLVEDILNAFIEDKEKYELLKEILK